MVHEDGNVADNADCTLGAVTPRRASSLGHWFQQASLCWARSASNSTKSSSHQKFSVRNFSKRCRASPDAVCTKFRPASNRKGILRANIWPYSTGAEAEGSRFAESSLAASSFAASIHPRSANRSRLMRRGFPAKAEVEEYGELP